MEHCNAWGWCRVCGTQGATALEGRVPGDTNSIGIHTTSFDKLPVIDWEFI